MATHHAWVSRFWVPGREAYIGLGSLYADDPRFADQIDAHADGLSGYLRDAIAVGEAHGPQAGLAALADVASGTPRRDAAAAYLHEMNGELELAAQLYAAAARTAPNVAERNHQMRQAARVNQALRAAG